MTAAAVAALAATSAGCGSSDSGDSTSGSGGGDKVDVKLGVLAGLTGDNAPLGQPWVESTKLAVDQINAALKERGDDSTVEVVGVEDSQGQVASAIAGARKLVDIDKANAIIGDTASAPSIAVAQSVTVPKQILEFTLGTSPAITELDDDGYFWRPSVSDALQGTVLAQVFGEEVGKDGKINIAYHDDAYGQGVRDLFKDAWEKGGGTIGNEVALSGKGTAYETEAQELVQGDPDGWLLVIFCTDWGKLRGPLVRTGEWDPKRTLIADAAAYCEPPDTLPAGLGGTMSTLIGDHFDAFKALYEEKAPSDAPFQDPGGIAFDAAIMTFLAAKAAKSSDPEKIKDKLVTISGPPGKKVTFEDLPAALDALEAGEEIDYEGVTSGIDFDEQGDITANFFTRWVADPTGGFKTVGERFAAAQN